MPPPPRPKRPVPQAPAKPAASNKDTGSAAFDVWLDRGLHDLYDQFAQEPIPDALREIIEADRAKKS